MTTLTAEAIHLVKLIEQQERAIVTAMERRDELKSQLVELRQQEEDRRPGMRVRLKLQGRAAVAEAVRILGAGEGLTWMGK